MWIIVIAFILDQTTVLNALSAIFLQFDIAFASIFIIFNVVSRNFPQNGKMRQYSQSNEFAAFCQENPPAHVFNVILFHSLSFSF